MPIKWLPWDSDAFVRARESSKPLLLSITAAWSQGCLAMERTTYADAGVQDLVASLFVPIRVDADKRPDIAERYSLGGLPTTAFLTPDGAIIGGGTYVGVERMPRALDRASEAFRTRREEIENRARALASRTAPPEPGGPASIDALISEVFHAYDREYGGFGSAPKFPITAPLHLALAIGNDATSSVADMVEHTLDCMSDSALYDGVDGGFFRYAARRDWSGASDEKVLDVNASLVRAYVEAADTLRLARYRDRALDVLRYAQTWLAHRDEGAWASSQHADPSYYAECDPAARAKLQPPAVDVELYCGSNASMVSAMLAASHSLDDSGLGEFAIKSLERLLVACYEPGGGVAHFHDGEAHVRGLLDDQVRTAAAALDAFEGTGDITYEMIAEELGHYMLRNMWDERDDGFFDRVHSPSSDEIGLMNARVKPFVANCEAARMLIRLAKSSGNHEFDARAEATLRAFGGAAPSQGPLAAHYVLAMRESRLR